MRPGVVGELTELAAAVRNDRDMADFAARALALGASTSELQAVSRVLADQAVEQLTAAGALKAAPTILDWPIGQLEILSAVWQTLRVWDCCIDRSRPLGHILKVIPTPEAARVRDALALAGFLSADDEQPTSATP